MIDNIIKDGVFRAIFTEVIDTYTNCGIYYGKINSYPENFRLQNQFINAYFLNGASPVYFSIKMESLDDGTFFVTEFSVNEAGMTRYLIIPNPNVYDHATLLYRGECWQSISPMLKKPSEHLIEYLNT